MLRRESVHTIHCSLACGMSSSRPITGNAIATDVTFEFCQDVMPVYILTGEILTQTYIHNHRE